MTPTSLWLPTRVWLQAFECCRVAAIAIFLSGSATSAIAQPIDSLTSAQQLAVQKIVHDYITAHPEVVMQALQKLQSEQQASQVASTSATIDANANKLLNDRTTPVLGDQSGNLTVVEFADYQCPYCRAMEPTVQKIIAHNPTLRVVMKDFPILGRESEIAARVGLVAAKQGKYPAYRAAVLAQPTPLSEQEIWHAASIAGVDINAAKHEITAPWVDAELAQDASLGNALEIQGTPAFVVGDTLIQGAVSQGDLQNLIDHKSAKH